MKYRLFIVLAASVMVIVERWTVEPIVHHSVRLEKEKELTGAAELALFHKLIRTADGATEPAYTSGYRWRESQKARVMARSRNRDRMQSTPIVWTERGPGNIAGRTRGLIVDPDDAAKSTWYAGSAGGGVWKTTNSGGNWTLLTPDFANLGTTVLAMAASDHNIIYVGTGEPFNNIGGVNGNGIFKSTNRGVSWTHLPSTTIFKDISRIAIDPTDASIVVAASETGIYRTVDGGANWTQVSSIPNVQDLKATPGNFNVQYASPLGEGVLKSIDAGITWTISGTGLNLSGRTEIGISTAITSRIFASMEGGISGGTGDLYTSADAGATWSLVDVSYNGNPADYLGGQGWYDNAVACDPFNASVVYVGGVNLFRVQLGIGSTEVANYKMEENGTEDFMFLQSFGTILFDGQRLTAGPAAGVKLVELRFGPGLSQFAHRFTVPPGATSGVSRFSHSYAGYVQIPFQAWDVTNPGSPKQVMVSFRDQANNGVFDLVPQYFGPDPTLNSREYTYIHNVDYSATPHPSIATTGGQEHQFTYQFFPALAEGATWDPNNLPSSTLLIKYSGVPKLNATTTTVSDAYNQFDGKNRFINWGTDLHPDQHNMVMIPVTGSTYRILLANDGGVFYSGTSSSPGITNGEWTKAGTNYRTGQFYGADKRPGFDQYAGGMQDNGTWKSPPTGESTASTAYQFSFGGDGFDVIWHNLDDQKMIGGSQGNVFRRTTNGGISWDPATSGLTGQHPFVSKLANSRKLPDRIFTLGSAGVFRSIDFGASWTLIPITTKWGYTNLMDVEVSRANANIIWAGSGMSGTTLALHVSTNGGTTFTPTQNADPSLVSGGITKLASHPFEGNTAYALFSQAGNAKILRTTDLGQTWEDISGFDSGDVSTRGFPDVAVYCLYVRQDNPDILWAGTEVGIVESLDNGLTWTLIEDFPNLSVWDMKGMDDQVVIATHGRGIWTATIGENQDAIRPMITAYGTSPKKQLVLSVNLEEDYSTLEFYNSTQLVGSTTNATAGNWTTVLPGLPQGQHYIKIIGYQGTAPVHSKTYTLDKWNVKDVTTSHVEYFGTSNNIVANGFGLATFPGSDPSDRQVLQSPHPYPNNSNQWAVLLVPVVVSSTSAILTYDDVALVEPALPGAAFGMPEFNDFVVMEASKNGLDWQPIADGYNAASDPAWTAAWTTQGSRSLLRKHEVNLLDTFVAGDTLLFRYRLNSNAASTGWGAAVDYIAVQETPTATTTPSGKESIHIYPNPADTEATVRYTIHQPGKVVVELFDLSGKVLHSAQRNHVTAGTFEAKVPVRNVTPGTYVVLLRTPGGVYPSKVVVGR